MSTQPTTCPVYGQDNSRCNLPFGHPPVSADRNHQLVQEVAR